jgi:hypothetical protein
MDLAISNCTTNIRTKRSINERAPWDWRMLVNGKADEMLYEHHAIATGGLPFSELKQRSLINKRARVADKDPDFSRVIREELPEESVAVFKLFQSSFPPIRNRAKYVPDGAYRTTFCTAVVCQTFSSDALIYLLASPEFGLSKRRHRSKSGANASLQNRRNNANYRRCGLVESKMTPSEASNGAV